MKSLQRTQLNRRYSFENQTFYNELILRYDNDAGVGVGRAGHRRRTDIEA